MKGFKTMQSPPTGFHLLLLATSFLPSFFLPFLHKLLCPTFLPGEEDLPFPLLSMVPKDEQCDVGGQGSWTWVRESRGRKRQMLYDLKQRVSKQRQFTPPVAFHRSLASSQKFPLTKLTIKEMVNGDGSRIPKSPQECHLHYPNNEISGPQKKGGVSKSWTIKKAECGRIDAFQLWCWKRLLRDPWTARRSNQSI